MVDDALTHCKEVRVLTDEKAEGLERIMMGRKRLCSEFDFHPVYFDAASQRGHEKTHGRQKQRSRQCKWRRSSKNMNFDPVMSGMYLQGNSEIKENGLGRKLKICSPRGKHARISSSSSEQWWC